MRRAGRTTRRTQAVNSDRFTSPPDGPAGKTTQPRPRLGLRIKLFGVLVLVLGVTQIGIGLHRYHADNRTNQTFLTQQLQRAAAGLQPQLDIAVANLSQLAAQITRSLGDDAGPKSDIEDAIASELLSSVHAFHLYDSGGDLLARWGWRDPPADHARGQIDRVLIRGEPSRLLRCEADCELEVWLPLVDRGGHTRVARISEPLAVVLQRMHQVLGIDLVLTADTAGDGQAFLGQPILAMTRAEFLRPRLETFERRRTPIRHDAAFTVDMPGEHWLLSPHPVGWREPKPATIVLALDVTSHRTAQLQATRNAAYATGWGLLLSLIAVMWLVSPIIRRLRRVTDALPLLADNAFEQARQHIGTTAPAGARPADEVDALRQSARWLTDRLEHLDEVESASAAKSEYLAMVSHEIRTPLNGILGMLELLSNEPLTEEQRQQIRIARDSAESLHTVIDDILDISRIEARRLTLHKTRFELAQVVEDAAAALWSQALKKRLKLVVFIAPELPAHFIGDPGRVRQILINLIGNAIKFTETGRVSVRAEPAEHGALRIQVRDTGIGISADAQARLFEPFSQANNATSKRYGGSGLGLSISQGLAALMQGRISVESEPGAGSLFSVVLPLPACDPDEPQPAGTALPPFTFSVNALADEEERNVIERYLANLGQPKQGDDAEIRFADADEALHLNITGRDHRRARLNRPIRKSELMRAVAELVEPLPAPPRKDTARGTDDPRTRRQQHRALVVEDHPVNRHVLTRQLELLDFAVTTSVNGREALEQLDHADFDVLITDLEMPELDGLSLCRAIRSSERHFAAIPIVIVTAHTLQFDRDHAMNAGANAYAIKPLNLETLKSVLSGLNLQTERRDPTPPVAPVDEPSSSTSAPVDTTYLQQEMGVGVSELPEVLGLFLDANTEQMDALSSAVELARWSDVHRIAHRIRGSANTAGARAFAAALARLEDAEPATTRARLDEVQIEYRAIEAFTRELVSADQQR